jgi:hypothetical protein
VIHRQLLNTSEITPRHPKGGDIANDNHFLHNHMEKENLDNKLNTMLYNGATYRSFDGK